MDGEGRGAVAVEADRDEGRALDVAGGGHHADVDRASKIGRADGLGYGDASTVGRLTYYSWIAQRYCRCWNWCCCGRISCWSILSNPECNVCDAVRYTLTSNAVWIAWSIVFNDPFRGRGVVPLQ